MYFRFKHLTSCNFQDMLGMFSYIFEYFQVILIRLIPVITEYFLDIERR